MSNGKIKKSHVIDKNLIKKIKILETKYNLRIELKLENDKGAMSFKFSNKKEHDELINKLND